MSNIEDITYGECLGTIARLLDSGDEREALEMTAQTLAALILALGKEQEIAMSPALHKDARRRINRAKLAREKARPQ